MRSAIDTLLALPCALLPKRLWPHSDLPIAQVSAVSAVLTLFIGVAVGIRGYFAYLEALRHIDGLSMLAVGQAQVSGALPETTSASVAPFAVAATAPLRSRSCRPWASLPRISPPADSCASSPPTSTSRSAIRS